VNHEPDALDRRAAEAQPRTARTFREQAARAEAAIARVCALHAPASDWSWKPLGCQHDGQHNAPCRGCRGECWPCPTIRALDEPAPVSGPAATQTTEPAWTPPPPGSTREQLPNHILDIARPDLTDYLSTACQTADTVACAACYPRSGVPRPEYDELRAHAERLHNRCRENQKFTGQLCVCGCHPDQPKEQS